MARILGGVKGLPAQAPGGGGCFPAPVVRSRPCLVSGVVLGAFLGGAASLAAWAFLEWIFRPFRVITGTNNPS